MKATVVEVSKLSSQESSWVCDNALREAGIAMRLSHPNVVTTYSYMQGSQPATPDSLLSLRPNNNMQGGDAPWRLDLVQVWCGGWVRVRAVLDSHMVACMHAGTGRPDDGLSHMHAGTGGLMMA